MKRVLVVDDDENVRFLVRRRLGSVHFTIDEASSGDEAIEKLRSAPYHLVILDLVMGRGGGIDVLKVMDDSLYPPKCIIISALAQVWMRQSGRRACPVLQKPFDPDRLMLLVQDELGIVGSKV